MLRESSLSADSGSEKKLKKISCIKQKLVDKILLSTNQVKMTGEDLKLLVIFSKYFSGI